MIRVEKDKKIIADIKNNLQSPKSFLEILRIRGEERNDVPDDLIDDSLECIRKSIRLLNQLARWDKKGRG